MTITVTALTVLVAIAYAITLAAPIIMLYLFWQDYKGKRLW